MATLGARPPSLLPCGPPGSPQRLSPFCLQLMSKINVTVRNIQKKVEPLKGSWARDDANRARRGCHAARGRRERLPDHNLARHHDDHDGTVGAPVPQDTTGADRGGALRGTSLRGMRARQESSRGPERRVRGHLPRVRGEREAGRAREQSGPLLRGPLVQARGLHRVLLGRLHHRQRVSRLRVSALCARGLEHGPLRGHRQRHLLRLRLQPLLASAHGGALGGSVCVCVFVCVYVYTNLVHYLSPIYTHSIPHPHTFSPRSASFS